jgi:MFS family permease
MARCATVAACRVLGCRLRLPGDHARHHPPDPAVWPLPAAARLLGGVLTVIFATYAAGVLIALLAFGALSDRIGRRPVLAAGLGLAVVSTAVFLRAGDLVLLFVGRLLSGLAMLELL